MLAADKLFKKIKPRFDDDFVDRFNYIYSPALLGAFAITIVAKQYVGQPLQCWVPSEFRVIFLKDIKSKKKIKM